MWKLCASICLVLGAAGAILAISLERELPGVAATDTELHEMKAAATIHGFCSNGSRCEMSLGYCNPFNCGSGTTGCGYCAGEYNRICYPYASAYQCETLLPPVTPCCSINTVCLSYWTGCYCYGSNPGGPVPYGSYTVC